MRTKLMLAKICCTAVFLFGAYFEGVTVPAEATDQSGKPTPARLAVGSSAIVNFPTSVRDVLVRNPDIVDVVARTKEAAYLSGQSVGRTNVFFLDTRGPRILNLHLEVAHDSEALRQPLRRSMSKSKITVDSVAVGLGFTPIVLFEDNISLKITMEVSELSSENAIVMCALPSSSITVPGLKVRQAETVIELPSGGSMVMAGLIQQSQKQQIDGTLGLKDVPVVGVLFRSRDYQLNETELAAIVTPYVVKPASEGSLAMPVDELRIAPDRQTILFGRLNKYMAVARRCLPASITAQSVISKISMERMNMLGPSVVNGYLPSRLQRVSQSLVAGTYRRG